MRAVIMFTLLLFILIFCFQNRQEVDIAFLNLRLHQLPLFIAFFGTLFTGLLIGFLAGMISGTKSKRQALRKSEPGREEEQRQGTSEKEKNTSS